MSALPHYQALAQATANLQSIPVFFTCIAQDPEVADDFWNNNEAPREKVQEMKQRLAPALVGSSWAACARRKQWVPKAMCRDVVDAYKVERGLDLRPAMSKYEDDIHRLKPMYDYFEAAFPHGGVERPGAPACPE